MIKMKNIYKIICLSVLFIGTSSEVSYITSEATGSILETEITTNNESQANNSNVDTKNTANVPSGKELKPEDFIDEFEMPEKPNSGDWQDDLLKPEDFLPSEKVTIKDFENIVLTRMLEVVSFLQTFAKPFCILLFIICGLGLLTSIVFGTNKQKMFILGLILSVVTYVGIIFAPDLVLFFANWLSF